MEKANEYVKDKEVVITGVEVELFKEKDSNNIKRIRFVGEENDITWKPTVVKEIFEDGIKILKKVEMTKEQIPQLIKDIAKKSQTDGKVNLTVEYTIFEKEVEGEETKQYRFITSEVQLNKWVIN